MIFYSKRVKYNTVGWKRFSFNQHDLVQWSSMSEEKWKCPACLSCTLSSSAALVVIPGNCCTVDFAVTGSQPQDIPFLYRLAFCASFVQCQKFWHQHYCCINSNGCKGPNKPDHMSLCRSGVLLFRKYHFYRQHLVDITSHDSLYYFPPKPSLSIKSIAVHIVNGAVIEDPTGCWYADVLHQQQRPAIRN